MKTLAFIIGLSAALLISAPLHATSETPPSMEEASGPVVLHENIVVSGPYVTLGDLFSNVPQDKMDTAVAYAPKPGRKASFDARWLYRVARAYKLQWRPLSADLNASVIRDSVVINRNEIEDAVMGALTQFNLPNNPHLELSNRQLRIHVPSDIMAAISVDDVTFNQRSNRFAAIISVGEEGKAPSQRIRLTGQVVEMLDIPTLAHRIARDDVIREHDLKWIKMRADRAPRDVLLDPANLVGMSPKRLIRPERPIRKMDIQSPVLVEKGSLVTIILKKPGMTLTAQGKALQSGSDGETIRIINSKTHRTIEAIVIGSSMVTVLPGDHKAAQLAYNN